MASENEPAKQLLPYLQRADELQKHEPLVAYYCRLYAMERGLKIPQNERTKTTNSLLISIMKQLEKDKKSLKLGPDDSLHLEGFASSVFAKADKQDRAGRADLSTAKTFYAASIFFEVLNQFGELQPDLEQKQKYAVWKAADIRKAMKEGRKPVPGPPGGDTDLSRTFSNEYDIEPSSTDRATKPAPESDQSHQSYDKVDPQHFSKVLPSPPTNIPQSHASNIPNIPQSHASNIPPSHPFPTDDNPSHNFHQPPPTNRSENSNEYPSHNYHQPPPSSRSENSTDNFPSHNYHQLPPSSGPENSTNDYPSHNYHPPPTNRSDDSSYPQPFQHQPYLQESPQHLPHNYPSQETPSFLYPNFQSYPSFTESSLPTVPSHIPSYYQGSEASYPIPPTSSTTNHQPAAQYNSSGRNGTVSEAAPTSPQSYQYDSNYQPPPEKIAEAHKAARFAVGALAFDDVSIAVDFLKKSLELLTNPSAGQ